MIEPMTARVFLLRAVNVGGAKLPMAELREIAADLGATDVSTYIASGNLIATPPRDLDGFERALEKAIEKKYGFFREVVSRTGAELRKALDAHPFEVVQSKYSYVSFMAKPPTKAAVEKARAVETGDDVWEVIGRDLHIRYADGAGHEQMKTNTILKALGEPATARNLNTVEKLIGLLSA
jgi:uncharacterized protein (DUF1697 family)